MAAKRKSQRTRKNPKPIRKKALPADRSEIDRGDTARGETDRSETDRIEDVLPMPAESARDSSCGTEVPSGKQRGTGPAHRRGTGGFAGVGRGQSTPQTRRYAFRRS